VATACAAALCRRFKNRRFAAREDVILFTVARAAVRNSTAARLLADGGLYRIAGLVMDEFFFAHRPPSPAACEAALSAVNEVSNVVLAENFGPSHLLYIAMEFKGSLPSSLGAAKGTMRARHAQHIEENNEFVPSSDSRAQLLFSLLGRHVMVPKFVLPLMLRELNSMLLTLRDMAGMRHFGAIKMTLNLVQQHLDDKTIALPACKLLVRVLSPVPGDLPKDVPPSLLAQALLVLPRHGESFASLPTIECVACMNVIMAAALITSTPSVELAAALASVIDHDDVTVSGMAVFGLYSIMHTVSIPLSFESYFRAMQKWAHNGTLGKCAAGIIEKMFNLAPKHAIWSSRIWVDTVIAVSNTAHAPTDGLTLFFHVVVSLFSASNCLSIPLLHPRCFKPLLAYAVRCATCVDTHSIFAVGGFTLVSKLLESVNRAGNWSALEAAVDAGALEALAQISALCVRLFRTDTDVVTSLGLIYGTLACLCGVKTVVPSECTRNLRKRFADSGAVRSPIMALISRLPFPPNFLSNLIFLVRAGLSALPADVALERYSCGRLYMAMIRRRVGRMPDGTLLQVLHKATVSAFLDCATSSSIIPLIADQTAFLLILLWRDRGSGEGTKLLLHLTHAATLSPRGLAAVRRLPGSPVEGLDPKIVASLGRRYMELWVSLCLATLPPEQLPAGALLAAIARGSYTEDLRRGVAAPSLPYLRILVALSHAGGRASEDARARIAGVLAPYFSRNGPLVKGTSTNVIRMLGALPPALALNSDLAGHPAFVPAFFFSVHECWPVAEGLAWFVARMAATSAAARVALLRTRIAFACAELNRRLSPPQAVDRALQFASDAVYNADGSGAAGTRFEPPLRSAAAAAGAVALADGYLFREHSGGVTKHCFVYLTRDGEWLVCKHPGSRTATGERRIPISAPLAVTRDADCLFKLTSALGQSLVLEVPTMAFCDTWIAALKACIVARQPHHIPVLGAGTTY
jgi:hypothetical protein